MIECFVIAGRENRGTRGSQIRVQHSSVLKSRHSIWVRHKIADMAICSRCMHAYLNAMMLGVATGSPHALHAMISRIAAGYPLIGVIDPDTYVVVDHGSRVHSSADSDRLGRVNVKCRPRGRTRDGSRESCFYKRAVQI